MVHRRKFLVGTRASSLAITQTKGIIDLIQKIHLDVDIDIIHIETNGDMNPQKPLADFGTSIFVKEIEDALLRSEIDIAVHSLKDLLTTLPQGLILGAISKREDPRDALITQYDYTIENLPFEAVIGTSSPRRSALLKNLRPDLNIVPIRGNIDTRLRKLSEEYYDGIILAAAGLRRLGLTDSINQYLNPEKFVPAVGQGALGIEIRSDDHETLELIEKINDPPTHIAVTAERMFLSKVGEGCAIPIAAYGHIEDNNLYLIAMAGTEDGSNIFKVKLSTNISSPEEAGIKLAQKLLKSGAKEILPNFN